MIDHFLRPRRDSLRAAGSLLLLAWLVAIVGCESQSDAARRPQLAVPITYHDCGEVVTDTALRHQFTVHNHGGSRALLNLDVCCGQVASGDHKILLPGGQTELPLRLETAGRTGRVEETMVWTTNDPELPRVEFTLSANVVDSPSPGS